MSKVEARPEDSLEGSELLAQILIREIERQTGNQALEEPRQELIRKAVIDYLGDSAKLADLKKVIDGTVNSTTCLTRLKGIMRHLETPFMTQHLWSSPDKNDRRENGKKFWTTEEDNRLYAAVYKFGLNQWALVSQFLGGGRSRTQCYQRWTRVLDPRLTPVWTEGEVSKLITLASSGKYTWGAIAVRLGTKSDLRCRYKYRILSQSHDEEQQTDQSPNSGSQSESEDLFFLVTSSGEHMA